MNGFFNVSECHSASRPDGKNYSCVTCGLYKNGISPRMQPSGGFKKRILNVGSINNAIEDQQGTQWQGSSSTYLKRAYERLGIDLYEDCLNINAINCFPGTNVVNLQQQILCCRKTVIQTIKEYQPAVIVLFGIEAVQSVIGTRWKKDLGKIERWRGWTIPDQEFNAWICPVYHPTQIEQVNKEVMTIWTQDLKRIVEKINQPIPQYNVPSIEIIEDLRPLNQMAATVCAFDYETTGLKPHGVGHRIVCASIADTEDHAYVFMMPQKKIEIQPFIDFLENARIAKMAHNMKYEDTWSKVRLHTTVSPWLFDSMVAAHILDNREYITSLKFQAYVMFGIDDYDSDIAPYLHSGSKDGNAINRVLELIALPEGKEKLMTYCAYDSIYEYRLAMLQMTEMNFFDYSPWFKQDDDLPF